MLPGDVSIRWGDVPTDLPGVTPLREVCWARAGKCLVNYPKIGRLLAESGERITAALAEGGDPGFLRVLIAVTGMTAILYQRGELCLHASAVAKDGEAVLIMGDSGAGKSTLSSALLKRGYAFISDDVSVVCQRSDGAFEVIRSYPSIRLHADSYRELDLFDEHRIIDPVDDKHRLQPPLAQAVDRAVIRRICHLRVGPESLPTTRAIPGVERVQILQQNLFRPRLAVATGDTHRLLKMSLEMAARLEMKRLERPATGFQLDTLCALATA
jgi:hypothetical protein